MARETDGGVEYGCTFELQDRAEGIRRAAQDLANLGRRGQSLPSEYVIAGEAFDVVVMDNLTANGSTDNQTNLANAVSASRGGTPTLLVLPPAVRPYRYSNTHTLSANTYLCGYGAIVMPLTVENTRFDLASNSGIVGLHMYGVPGSYSRWPERFQFEENYNDLGVKNGTIANAANDDNSAAWVQMYEKSNCLMLDVQARGSIQGTLRCISSTNCLIDGGSSVRTHSDSYHLTHSTSYCTVRNLHIEDAGDDAVSQVQYGAAGQGNFPNHNLVEHVNVKGGRARGLTCVSAQDALFRWCKLTDITLGAFRFGPTSVHSNDDTLRIKVYDSESWRSGRMNSSNNNAGAFAALLSTSSYRCRDVDFKRCRGYTHAGDFYHNGTFVRESNSYGTGGITYTTDDCSIVGISYTE